MRNRHTVSGLPVQYVFFLKCCMARDCPHPLCQQSIDVPRWFPSGPTLQYFSLPIPDPAYPWGNTKCGRWQKSVCYGHFLTPQVSLLPSLPPMVKPPSQTLKDAFSKLNGKEPTENYVEALVQATLLPPKEVKMWFENLHAPRCCENTQPIFEHRLLSMRHRPVRDVTP